MIFALRLYSLYGGNIWILFTIVICLAVEITVKIVRMNYFWISQRKGERTDISQWAFTDGVSLTLPKGEYYYFASRLIVSNFVSFTYAGLSGCILTGKNTSVIH